MADRIDPNQTIQFSGTYWDEEGDEHEGKDMTLTYVEEFHDGDPSVGIPDVHLVDATDLKTGKTVSIDCHEWYEIVCENTGGHDFANEGYGPEPDEHYEICTRCGKEQ